MAAIEQAMGESPAERRMNSFTYTRATEMGNALQEAVENDAAKFIAGAADLMKYCHATPPRVMHRPPIDRY